MMNEEFCKAVGLSLSASIKKDDVLSAQMTPGRGNLFEPVEEGVSMEALDAANRTLTGVIDAIAEPNAKKNNVWDEALQDGVWAAGTMQDMVDGAKALDKLMNFAERNKPRNPDVLPQDIAIGDSEYIPEGEMSIPDLALRPGATHYDVVKSSKIFIGKHPPPEISMRNMDFGPTKSIETNAQEHDLQRLIGDMKFIVPEELNEAATKQGYWSMRLPSLRQPVVDKAMTALKMMVGTNPLSCVYVDSPDIMLRFDFRKRQFSGARMHRDLGESQALWRGICSDRRAERLRELQAQFSTDVLPLYAEDIIQMTKEDGDALIRPGKEYKEPIPAPVLEEYMSVLRGLLLRRFVYSGLSIFVKRSRNDLLMSHNCTEEEVRARELLCEMIGHKEYCNYLRRGFIVVQGRSGQRYVIKGGYSMIEVYGKGADGKWMHVEALCIQFKDYNLTHTDSVIMRKLFVEHDEFALRQKSNATKRSIGLEEARIKRRQEQRNPTRETSRDEFLTWERSQDPASIAQDRQELAAQLGAAFRQTQEQRVG